MFSPIFYISQIRIYCIFAIPFPISGNVSYFLVTTNYKWHQTKWNTNVIKFLSASIQLVAGDICYFLLLLPNNQNDADMSWFSIKDSNKDLLSMQYLNRRVRLAHFSILLQTEGLNGRHRAPLPQLWQCSPPLSLCSPLCWPGSGPRLPPRPRTDSGSDKTASALARPAPRNSRVSRSVGSSSVQWWSRL